MAGADSPGTNSARLRKATASEMTVVRRLLSGWLLVLAGSLLLPSFSTAAAFGLAHHVPATATTTPAIIAEHASVAETDRSSSVDAQDMASGQTPAPFCIGRSSVAPKKGLSSRGLKPKPGTRVRPDGVPDNWRIRGTDTPGGVEYYNPRNPNQSVRVMQGNPNSPYPNSRAPYARQRNAGGTYYKKDGTLSTGRRGGRYDPDAHIPLDEFKVVPE
jgi:hypothetical protein